MRPSTVLLGHRDSAGHSPTTASVFTKLIIVGFSDIVGNLLRTEFFHWTILYWKPFLILNSLCDTETVTWSTSDLHTQHSPILKWNVYFVCLRVRLWNLNAFLIRRVILSWAILFCIFCVSSEVHPRSTLHQILIKFNNFSPFPIAHSILLDISLILYLVAQPRLE